MWRSKRDQVLSKDRTVGVNGEEYRYRHLINSRPLKTGLEPAPDRVYRTQAHSASTMQIHKRPQSCIQKHIQACSHMKTKLSI